MRSPIVTFLFISGLLFSCANEPSGNHDGHKSNAAAKKSNFKIELNSPNSKSRIGDVISISVKPNSEDIKWDSAQISLDRQYIVTIFPKANGYQWNSGKSKVGNQQVEAKIFIDSTQENARGDILLHSNLVPEEYKFEVVNQFPHDSKAFTQGLLFADNIFYEGTGMKGESEIRKVKVESGEVIKRTKLNSNLFGEGITIYNNNLYQLTWKAGLALVYNKDEFNEISKLYYQGDGWGLTNDAEALYLSDGTNVIRILRPEDFTVIDEIQVYDNKGSIGFINELEMINGKIFANIWQKDVIIIIDPKTGKVEGQINLAKLYPSSEIKPGVLNGIAYDSQNDRLFVTGKYWPKVYEIKISKKGITSS